MLGTDQRLDPFGHFGRPRRPVLGGLGSRFGAGAGELITEHDLRRLRHVGFLRDRAREPAGRLVAYEPRDLALRLRRGNRAPQIDVPARCALKAVRRIGPHPAPEALNFRRGGGREALL